MIFSLQNNIQLQQLARLGVCKPLLGPAQTMPRKCALVKVYMLVCVPQCIAVQNVFTNEVLRWHERCDVALPVN